IKAVYQVAGLKIMLLLGGTVRVARLVQRQSYHSALLPPRAINKQIPGDAKKEATRINEAGQLRTGGRAQEHLLGHITCQLGSDPAFEKANQPIALMAENCLEYLARRIIGSI